jgi:hypothetical protein
MAVVGLLEAVGLILGICIVIAAVMTFAMLGMARIEDRSTRGRTPRPFQRRPPGTRSLDGSLPGAS